MDSSLYEVDYGLWLKNQIASLKQHHRSNKRELYSYTVVVLAHLLKW
jgi:hypothetical protein